MNAHGPMIAMSSYNGKFDGQTNIVMKVVEKPYFGYEIDMKKTFGSKV